jgi:hypothetical protein
VAYGSLFAFSDAYTSEGVRIPTDLTTSLLDLVGTAVAIALVTGIVGGFLPRGISPRQSVPNEGIRRSVRRVRSILLIALGLVVAFLVLTPSSSPPSQAPDVSPIEAVVGLLVVTVIFLGVYMVLLLPILLWAGGKASLQHLVLRYLLVRNGVAPWRYVRFLDEASDRLFLRKVGGGYVFVHRLLLEYFADLRHGEAATATPRTADAVSGQ